MKKVVFLALTALSLVSVSCGRDEDNGTETVKTSKDYLLNRWKYNEILVEYGGQNGGVKVIRYNDECSSKKMLWFKESYLEDWDYVNINSECKEAIAHLKYSLEGNNLAISDGYEKINYELVKVNETELIYRLKKDYNYDGVDDVITYKFDSK